ncbi:MAG TPA: hypothetical protein VK424_03525 [Thermoplasmata archaeon]|nr:hypothetical protein [Thermoplasmata archaeon]
MGGTPPRNASRRYRRARRRLRGERGVVAVIGTLLALLVFFTLFGVFITEYLPLWMTENEAAFTSAVDLSFANFKSNVDTQYQFPLAVPSSLATPFTMSSQGVPLLAQPTEGTLLFLPSTCPKAFIVAPAVLNVGQPVNDAYCMFANVTLSAGPGGSGPFSQHFATGALEMNLPNRYYTPENFFFEDDAVIQSQIGGYQVMTANAPLNITHSATGNTTVTDSMLQLYGNSSTYVAQGGTVEYSHFRYSQPVTSSGALGAVNHTAIPFVFTFEIGTQFPCAWNAFLRQTMAVSGLSSSNITLAYTPSTFVPTPAACMSTGGATTILTLTVFNVNFAKFYYAGVQVSNGVGGT